MPNWTLEAQIAYPLITEVVPAPDGQQIAFCVREPLQTEDRSEFLVHLFLAEIPSGQIIQLTYGDHSDHTPCWSPDGQYLAFISTRSGHAELRAIRASGGESWPLATIAETDITAPVWSRDGTRIAFLAPAPRSAEEERTRRARDDAYTWGQQDRRSQISIVPFSIAPRPLPTPQPVTNTSFHVIGFDWLADGSGFAFTAASSPNADYWPETWLATIQLTSTEPSRLGIIASWSAAPKVSPDGRTIACVASDGAPHWAFAARVVLFPVTGEPAAILAATPDEQPELLGWSPDSTILYVSEVEGVGARLFALPASGATPHPLDGPAMFEPAGLGLGGHLVVAGEDFGTPNALYRIDANGGPHAHIATLPLPAEWPDAPLPRAEVMHWQSSDGMEIEGIVTYPLVYEEGQSYPLVVIVHGGPSGVYQRVFLGNPGGYGPICGLAEQGYATLRATPRGSSGYGRAFRFANQRDWGGGDFRDIMAGVDALVARGLADPQRLAIMGWSYGGFMSSWAITQTKRFAAACIGAPVTDPISFNGTADIPGFIPDYFGAEYWEDLEAYRRQSPLLHVANVVTPALIQHGDADIRVPLSQGRQFYAALRRRGIPSELVVYPRQGHLFSEPRMIIDSRKRVLAWLERYLAR